MKHKFFGFLVVALFATAGLNAMSLDVGLSLGVVPDIFSGNANIWAEDKPFAYTNEESYAAAEVNHPSFFNLGTGNSADTSKLAVSSASDISRNYDGSDGIVGMSVGLVARMRMNNLFFRLGVDYAFVIGGGTITNTESANNVYAYSTSSGSWVATGQSASYSAEVSVSGYILSIPITVIGVNIPVKVAGKDTVFYGGIGPSILVGSMKRELKLSSSGYAVTMAQAIGMTDNYAEMTYSATAIGFHWVVGAQAEVAPKIYIGFEVLGTKGGKVVTESITDSYSSTDPYAAYKTDKYLDGAYTSYIANANSSTTTTSGGTTTKNIGLTQTLNMSDVRMSFNVSYKVM